MVKQSFFNNKVLLISVLGLLFVHALAFQGWAAELKNYSLALENEFLRLYVRAETAEFAVEDIASGEVWYSATENINLERIKRGNARNNMRSLVVLNYFTPRREGKTLSSYGDSVLHEEFTVTIGPEQVRFDFTLGRQWGERSHYPIFIAKDTFEALVARVEDPFDQEILLGSYSLLNFVEQDFDPYERVSVFGLDLPAIFGNWEIEILSGDLKDTRMGLHDEPHERKKHLIERLADTITNNRSDVERRGLLTPADFDFVFKGPFYALLDETYKLYNRPEFARIFQELGYTPQDIGAEHQRHNIDPPRPNPEVFKVPVIVELDGRDLVVKVPAGEIGYPREIENDQGLLETFYPYSIDLLPYFGGAHESSEGYIFVPERSGALIELTNPRKNNLPAYSGAVYGVDAAIAPQIERIAQGPAIYLPVFGLVEGERAFFTILEEGASMAYINAESAGRSESFAKVYARYALTPRASIVLFGVESSLDNKMVDAYAVKPFQGDIVQRITFLTGEEADYVGMAKTYRDYLVAKHDLQKIEADEVVPLVVEMIGGIHDYEPSFGAPREVIRPLTSYADVLTILEDLKISDVKAARLRYVGWSKGGIEHYVPDRFSLEKDLGSKADFQALLEYTRHNPVELYLDVDFSRVYRNTWYDSFRASRDTSRFLNRSAVKIWDYNISTYQRDTSREAYAVSPRAIGNLVDRFLNSLAPYDQANLSLRRLGRSLYSDFIDDASKMVHRPEAEAILVEQLEKMKHAGRSLLVVGGNDYAAPYARQIVEAPTEASPLLIVDRNVPFYQIVFHGYVDYAGQPLNFGGITRQELLRSLERGELPFFRWSIGDSSLIKGTDFEYLLATNYYDSKDDALAFFHEVAPILQEVRGQGIVGHDQGRPGVYRTTYENGLQVLVNYTDKPVWQWGRVIPSEGYLVERGGDL